MVLWGMPMRADRLLALLLLLQSRGRMTAAELAAELECSERTIYRDLEALSMAGVPVFAERGPGGGCRLLEDWRSDLTGLTEAEWGALAALEIPAPLVQLGLGSALRQAFVKLAAARPERGPAVRIYVDPTPWAERAAPAVPLLGEVHRAVSTARRMRVARPGPHGAPLWLELDPCGLVAKEGRWYLLADAGEHTVVFRVDHLLAAEVLEAPARIPVAFDLRARWEQACAVLAADQRLYPVQLRASVALAGELEREFPEAAQEIAQALAAQQAGWMRLELPFGNLYEARSRLLGWGGAVEVLAPRPLRESLADFARQAAARYAPGVLGSA